MLPKCGFVEHISILNVSKALIWKQLYSGGKPLRNRDGDKTPGRSNKAVPTKAQPVAWVGTEWAALQQEFPTPPGPQTIWEWCPVTPSKQAFQWRQKHSLTQRLEVLGKVMTGIIFKNLGRSLHSSKSPTYQLYLASITCWAWISWESISQAPSSGQYTC